MNEHTAVVIGASGLIGNYIVNLLLTDDHFTKIRLLVRRKLEIHHPKLEQVIVNFNDIEDYTNKFGDGEYIFCSVGTTTKKVRGNFEAYSKVDFDIPFNAAKIGASKKFKKFLIVSSAGANANARSFYLRLKGRLENALKEFEFESVSFLRPGMLLGKRNEYRRGEKILQGITKIISGFLFSSLKKYHSIQGKDVANAMIEQSKKSVTGIHILEYNEMMNLIH